MKLSRNVFITLDEAKKKSATFARATATFGETLYTSRHSSVLPNHSELGAGAEQKRNSTIRTLENKSYVGKQTRLACLDKVRYEIQIRYTRYLVYYIKGDFSRFYFPTKAFAYTIVHMYGDL